MKVENLDFLNTFFDDLDIDNLDSEKRIEEYGDEIDHLEDFYREEKFL